MGTNWAGTDKDMGFISHGAFVGVQDAFAAAVQRVMAAKGVDQIAAAGLLRKQIPAEWFKAYKEENYYGKPGMWVGIGPGSFTESNTANPGVPQGYVAWTTNGSTDSEYSAWPDIAHSFAVLYANWRTAMIAQAEAKVMAGTPAAKAPPKIGGSTTTQQAPPKIGGSTTTPSSTAVTTLKAPPKGGGASSAPSATTFNPITSNRVTTFTPINFPAASATPPAVVQQEGSSNLLWAGLGLAGLALVGGGLWYYKKRTAERHQMDLMAFGGPAGPCYAQQVAWQRPTSVLSVAAGTTKNTSTDQAAVYQQLSSRDGYAWKAMCERAKIAPEELGNLGIGGFSAFHGFANAFLKNAEDYSRCAYVHLADACFLGAGATSPHAGYAKFATDAAMGLSGKMMTVTTNGPWGKPLSYSYDYGNGDVVQFNLTSGAQCFELVWNEATKGGLSVSTPETPPGMPPPDRAMRVGNLIWLHYEKMVSGLPKPCGGEYSPHGWHVVALATPMMSHFGAPWMADVRPGLSGLIGGGNMLKTAVVAGVAALAAFVVWKALTRNSFRPNKLGKLLEQMPKRCNCCKELYTELKWNELPLLGFGNFDWGESLEYRNCPCGSTLTRSWEHFDDQIPSQVR